MKNRLSPAMLAQLSERFRALGEPSRLAVLDALHDGERSVSELVAATGQAQASVSRNLAHLHDAGWVAKRREGNFIYYRAADEDVWALCDLVCGKVRRDTAAAHGALLE